VPPPLQRGGMKSLIRSVRVGRRPVPRSCSRPAPALAGVLLLSLGLGVPVPVVAGGSSGEVGGPVAPSSRPRTVSRTSPTSLTGPRTSGALPLEVRFWLRAGFRLALERLEEEPACAGLFGALGGDGRELLARTVYTLPVGPRESGACRRAVAFTTPGSVRTVVCPVRFRALPKGEAAAILLHEALHLAGLGEWPYVPEAPTSEEITELVRSRCRL